MALTLSRDLRFPVPGDKVTILGVFTVGTRFRTKLTNKPVASTLELFDAAKGNYLDNNQLIPDVPGCYTVGGVEETVTVEVPHHSTDLGGTLHKGVVDVSPPISTATHSCTVLGRVMRVIGFEPDTCTLEMWGGADDFTGGSTNGALTRFIDREKCPRLVDGTSDRAKIAMTLDYVARYVAEIGGYGNETVAVAPASYRYGDRPDQTQVIRSYDAIVDPAIMTSFAWMIARLNYHITAPSVLIHGVADAANVVTAGAATANTEATQRTLLNDIRVQMIAHVAIGGGGVHSTADSIATGQLAVLAALPGGSTLQQRIDRSNALFDIMDRHFTRRNLTLVPAAGVVHTTIADNHLDYTALYPVCDDATVVAAANAMKTEYNLHRVRVVLAPSPTYHNVLSGSDNTFNETMPTDAAGFVKAVGSALTVLHSHVTNYNPVTGATVAYHAEADFASRADFPGPTDFGSAVNAMEALEWALAMHAGKGTNVHGITHAGMCAVRPVGVEAIHHAYRSAVQYIGSAYVPPNENAALAQFVRCGGFLKG